MDDERAQELLRRIDELEMRVRQLEARDAPPADGPAELHAEHSCRFIADEKRIVDTIVRLTTENIMTALDERMRDRPREHHGRGPGGRRSRPHGYAPGYDDGPRDR